MFCVKFCYYSLLKVCFHILGAASSDVTGRNSIICSHYLPSRDALPL